MTNAVAAFRSLIVYALILPLALVMGYLLATPLDPTTLLMLTVVLLLLCTPLVLRWHHPLLFLSWNMTAVIFVLPGRPQVWLVVAFVSLGISIIQRALNPDMRFIPAASVLAPVLFLTVVVLITAKATGGFGMKIFGGDVYGGRRYFLVFASVAGFLAMIAHPIPAQKAKLYLGLFFLGMLTDAIGSSLPLVNPALYFIFLIFPVEQSDLIEGATTSARDNITRFFGLSVACQGVFYYLLARFGIEAMLGWRTFWRFVLLGATVVLCALGGFRSFFVLMTLTFVAVFYFEGLLRSRYAGIFAFVAIIGGLTVMPLAHKLPLSIQRTLSVLPLVDVDPVARYDAQLSTEWRVQMWKIVLPEVPKYFWFGKGLGISGQDLEMTNELARRGRISSQEVAMMAGDYHSGPLSVIIPFGIWGVIGWLWFLVASLRALHFNHLYGDESLKTINTFLLAYFVARMIHFFVVFGGFYTDFPAFTGVLGLSLCLNGGIRKPADVPLSVSPASEDKFSAPLKPSLSS
jgi:hypothetical protein